jgi:very-short-patch-repair endonuclease
MNKFIKNPSNIEVKLRNLVKEIFPDCEFQYPIFNYSLDIALVEEKIAIEYDGYYHFNCQESINYHNARQEKIEKEGWKFLRYTMFDKFPNKRKIEQDVQFLLKKGNINEKVNMWNSNKRSSD